MTHRFPIDTDVCDAADCRPYPLGWAAATLKQKWLWAPTGSVPGAKRQRQHQAIQKEILRDWFCIPVLSGAGTQHHKLFPQKHLKPTSGFRKDRLFASGTSGWSKLAEEITGEEGQVGGAFGESAHEIGKPVLAVGNVDADAKTVADQPALQIGAHAVEHLELKIAFRDL
jgi:hypothetical protein